ncbi:MAG: DUF4190 domain-containing protein [Chloroflexi bacterium]|nr:DUF4190 domain-containing protein [Chloroflexota bacterium]
MTCPVCGAANENSAAFCYRCGTPLKQSTPAATGPTVSLNRNDPPSFQSPPPVTLTSEEPHARVYDAPPQYPSSPGPSFTVPSGPQYSQPGQQYQPGTSAYGVTSNTAVFALIFGVASFLGIFFLGAIPAIILGRNARKEIAASGGRITGEGLAQAGIVLGWINIALTMLGICAFCAFFVILGAAPSP